MPRRGTGVPTTTWPDGALVGRDELIAELTGALDEASHGSGSIFVLTGEAGIGKSSVARMVARIARDDLTVSWARCSADGTAPPFWPWRALVTSTDAEAGAAHAESAPGAERFDLLNELRDQLVALA